MQFWEQYGIFYLTHCDYFSEKYAFISVEKTF